MNLSQVEKVNTAPATAGTADTNTTSITYYQGVVNQEKADYTIKYAGITPIDYTFYFYGLSKVRAISANTNDAMNLSQVEKVNTAPTTAGTADINTTSITYYQGIM